MATRQTHSFSCVVVSSRVMSDFGDINMNRKQLRALKAYERKHALEIAWRHASACGDLDNNGHYVRVTEPIAVNALY